MSDIKNGDKKALLPEGNYRAKAVHGGWKLGFTSNKNPQIAVAMDLLDSGRQLPWYGFFTDDTWERTVDSLTAMGWDGHDVNNIRELPKEVIAVVKHNTWKGKTRAKIEFINDPGRVAGLQSVMSEDDATGFAAELAQRMAERGHDSGGDGKPVQEGTEFNPDEF